MNMHLMKMLLEGTAPARKKNMEKVSPAMANGMHKVQEKLDGMFAPNKPKQADGDKKCQP